RLQPIRFFKMLQQHLHVLLKFFHQTVRIPHCSNGLEEITNVVLLLDGRYVPQGRASARYPGGKHRSKRPTGFNSRASWFSKLRPNDSKSIGFERNVWINGFRTCSWIEFRVQHDR